MCDNTAPYTAQEVHLVTTKFKIVDKYTVEYKNITVLTQAQSLKQREFTEGKEKSARIKANRFGTRICTTGGDKKNRKQNEIRQDDNESKENEATQELMGLRRT